MEKMTFKFKMVNGLRGQQTVETNKGISETMYDLIKELEEELNCEVDTMDLLRIRKVKK